MSIRIVIILICCLPIAVFSQSEKAGNDVIEDSISTINTPSFRKGRTIGVSTGIGAVWAGSMIGLHGIWYKGMERSKWHTFDDSREWLQMDKAGHVYTANKISDRKSVV